MVIRNTCLYESFVDVTISSSSSRNKPKILLPRCLRKRNSLTSIDCKRGLSLSSQRAWVLYAYFFFFSCKTMTLLLPIHQLYLIYLCYFVSFMFNDLFFLSFSLFLQTLMYNFLCFCLYSRYRLKVSELTTESSCLPLTVAIWWRCCCNRDSRWSTWLRMWWLMRKSFSRDWLNASTPIQLVRRVWSRPFTSRQCGGKNHRLRVTLGMCLNYRWPLLLS